MRHTALTLALLVAGVFPAAPGVLRAQQQSVAVAPTAASAAAATAHPTAASTTVVARMSATLRRLVIVEEGYWAAHGTYTTDVAALGMMRRSRDSVLVVVRFAGGGGWSARATHPAVKGKSCVVYVGDPADLPALPTTAADATRPAQEGEPVCDEPADGKR